MGLFGGSVGRISGFLGADPGKDDRRDARRTIAGLDIPDLEELTVQLQELVRVGEYTPDEAATILQQATEFNNVQTDPRLRGSQLGALSEFERIATEGGLDARGRAALEDVLERQRTESRGSQGAIMANARARGIGGSDLETVSRLVANQGAATQGARQAVDVAALREARRDQALAQQAGLASQIRGQDFGESSARASAQDAINRYNTANRQAIQSQNVDRRNEGQRFNLGEAQRISDSNTGIRNQQELYNRALPLDIYDREADKAAMLAGQYNAAAGGKAQAAQTSLAASKQFNQIVKDVFESIGSIGGGVAASEERMKEDVQPIDSRALLGELTGSTWNYKADGKPGVGVMAQDLERTPASSMVLEMIPGGPKMIDYSPMMGGAEKEGMTLALLSDINKRLENLEVRG